MWVSLRGCGGYVLVLECQRVSFGVSVWARGVSEECHSNTETTHIHTHTHRDGQTLAHRDRHSHAHTLMETETHTVTQRERHTHGETDTHTQRETESDTTLVRILCTRYVRSRSKPVGVCSLCVMCDCERICVRLCVCHVCLGVTA